MIIFAINYFGSNDLPRLIESLKKQDSSAWRLIIVDNSEDTVEHSLLLDIAQADVRVQILRAPTNLGYFGAARWAYDAISPDQDEWVAVSNTDICISTKNFVSSVMMRNDDNVGVIAPQIISDRTGQDQNPHLKFRPSEHAMKRRCELLSNPWLAQITILLSAAKSRLRLKSEHDSTSADIYAAHGSFMILSPAYFSAGGDFSHPVFLFAEEISVAETCQTLGLRTVYEPLLRITHVEHGQMGLIRSRKILSYTSEGARYAYEKIRG